ncbi:ABC transporter permease [Acidimangrovimonas pyrenivorans]|uniref:Transport permease protein n=1 Tax=Acidimangrovimonas pyrenivorans TaxID=2030798 RepID=A0ABV7ALX6_9RHOB
MKFPKQVQTRSFATGRVVLALILREMSTRYGRSPGGYIWAVLEPLGAIMMMSFAFSLMLRSPALGNSFILFYASGFLPFTLYNSNASKVAGALTFSKPLLAYPSVTWMDSVLARFLLNTLTTAVVAYLLLTSILILTNSKSVLDVAPIVVAMALAALLGLGIGTLNCVLTGLFPTWTSIWGIITRPLFIGSGIIFNYEDMPRNLQDVLWYNPLVHIVDYMRTGIYPSFHAEHFSLPYVMAWILIPFALGLVLLQRHHKDIISD